MKTAAFGLGFQHLPRDLANVNAWKNMFDPYTERHALFSTFAVNTSLGTLEHIARIFKYWGRQ